MKNVLGTDSLKYGMLDSPLWFSTRGFVSGRVYAILVDHVGISIGNPEMTLPDKVKEKTRGVYMIVRPEYTALAVGVAAVGMMYASKTIQLWYLIPLTAIMLHYMAVCVRDDIEDYEYDKQFRKNRPLVQKYLSEPQASTLWLCLHLIAVPLSLLVSVEFFVVMLFYIPSGILYSRLPYRISDRGLLGNICYVGFTVFLPFIGGAIAVGKLSPTIIAFGLVLWLWGLVIDLLKDFRYLERDKRETRTSFVLKLGSVRASRVYSVVTLAYLMLFPVVYYIFELNLLFLFITTIVALWLMYVTIQLLSRDLINIENLLRVSYNVLPALILLSIVLGSL